MVVPVAIAAGVAGKKGMPVAKAAVRKAADNPTESLFLAVLVGAVLIQGVKKLPNVGEWAWNRVVPFDVTAPFDYTKEAIEITAALNDEVITGFEQIGPDQDPVERQLFGSFAGTGPDELQEPGDWQKAYRGARTGLFTGLFNRGWFY